MQFIWKCALLFHLLKIFPDLTKESVFVDQNGIKVKCSICCPNCKKLVALSPYYTTAGIGFRSNNFARHVSNLHGEQKENIAVKQVVMVSRKRKIPFSNQNGIHRRRLIAKNVECASAQTLATVPDNQELEKLKHENDQLKHSISGLKEEKENLINDLQNTQAKLTQIESQSQVVNSNAEMVEWRQRATNLQMELTKIQSELYTSYMIRRDLLHSNLNLQGRLRVMARLRPVFTQGTNAMRIQINSSHNELKCKSVFFNQHNFSIA